MVLSISFLAAPLGLRAMNSGGPERRPAGGVLRR
jgi:hypothetical protein